MANYSRPLEETFKKRTLILSGVFGCWLWDGAHFSSGYGALTHKSKTLKAYRVSYDLYNGPIPEGMLVRHMCHNKGCVNPFHLRVGTAKDNAEDDIAAGIRPTGELHHESISPEIVQKVLAFSLKAPSRRVAAILGIGKTTVLRIRRGEHWGVK